jgi:hypothetical protein
MSRIPHFRENRFRDGGEIVSLACLPVFIPQEDPFTTPYFESDQPFHTTNSYLSKIHFINTNTHLGLTSGLFPSGFPTNYLYAS